MLISEFKLREGIAMKFGERMRACREELGLSRAELAGALGITLSAVSNYEKSISFPKEEIMLRLFDCLQTDPNTLFQDSFRSGGQVLTHSERKLLERYQGLSPMGRETVRSVVDALCAYRDDLEAGQAEREPRVIPLYRSPAAAGYAAPVFGEDFDYIQVTDDVPQAAEYAVRIQGDSMSPWIADGSVVYVNRDPLKAGDVGIFCVDGDILCKQYFKDAGGIVYLFSLNRARADADVVLTGGSGRTLVCFGRVIFHAPPLPGRE
jgi:repressor LexA